MEHPTKRWMVITTIRTWINVLRFCIHEPLVRRNGLSSGNWISETYTLLSASPSTTQPFCRVLFLTIGLTVHMQLAYCQLFKQCNMILVGLRGLWSKTSALKKLYFHERFAWSIQCLPANHLNTVFHAMISFALCYSFLCCIDCLAKLLHS